MLFGCRIVGFISVEFFRCLYVELRVNTALVLRPAVAACRYVASVVMVCLGVYCYNIRLDLSAVRSIVSVYTTVGLVVRPMR